MLGHADPRTFAYAVGASLALHAVLLALRAPQPPPPPLPSSAPIVAHLVEPEVPPAAPPVAEPAVEPRVEKRPPPKRERPKPKPDSVRPAPVPQPQTFSIAPTPAPAEAPAPASEPVPAPAAPAASVPGPLATAPPAPDLDTLIAQYRSHFIGAAVRYKRYPLMARDNGWEGDVLVHLEVSPSGELAEVKVKRGSGHGVLDEQALEMFRLAAPHVPVPAPLRGRAFGFDVRAVYSLKD